jgi:Raf kinase inhibitor-like YbhB/YbcL family protein
MQIRSDSFDDGAVIPDAFAFAKPDAENHVALSTNRNPHLTWSDVPDGTRSFVLICHDPDVPSRGDDVNQDGREVPVNLPRVDFFHWLLWNIPARTREIAAGSHSDAVTPRGKSGPDAPGGMRHGVNDYTGWFAGDAEMAGTYFGYDGPAPPWNDALVHHYVFTLYALDVDHLDVAAEANGAAVRDALVGHVLAQARLIGTCTLNPRLR